jgi:Arc/MetJ-type ribon-helix-helix transcriptional regulator
MRRTTITLPDDLADFLGSEARRRQTSLSDVIRQLIVERLTGTAGKPREIPWAGLFNDPEMVPAERLDEALAGQWADDIDRDRG